MIDIKWWIATFSTPKSFSRKTEKGTYFHLNSNRKIITMCVTSVETRLMTRCRCAVLHAARCLTSLHLFHVPDAETHASSRTRHDSEYEHAIWISPSPNDISYTACDLGGFGSLLFWAGVAPPSKPNSEAAAYRSMNRINRSHDSAVGITCVTCRLTGWPFTKDADTSVVLISPSSSTSRIDVMASWIVSSTVSLGSNMDGRSKLKYAIPLVPSRARVSCIA